jgi:cytochrome c oxidase subunit 3
MAKAQANQHDYHLVDPSPWPILGGVTAFVTAVGLIIWMRSMGDGEGLFGLHGPWVFLTGMIGIAGTMFVWWRDVINEAQHQGKHTPVVQMHLRYGMILFIASEVMFFVVWFWGFFDAALFPDEAVQFARTEFTGGQWPPKGVETFNPWDIPLVNTLILLTSGTTVTWAHHSLLHNNRRGLILGLMCTILLGMIFTALQAYEYAHATFPFAGSIYGATFFMATGFHGAHVLIGTVFLTITLFRALAGHFDSKQHFGFEAAAWYWHFVDVVWLFLFSCIYVWAAGAPAAH